ncbi:MAG: glutathione peroxidase [Pseudomonadota bacterium]
MIRVLTALMMIFAAPAFAEDFTFTAIEGHEIKLSDYRGGPVMVVNTASLCGFTYQYAQLQALHEDLAAKGLTVLAVPSDDFNQEYGSNEEVKEFCEVNYALTVPMTEVEQVTGRAAHPFYRWLADEHGFRPGWNFYKALLDADGRFVVGFGSTDEPDSERVLSAIRKLLPSG